MTSRILALVDGSTYATSVCHAAAWIAGKLGLGVDLLHTLPDAHVTDTGDLSGALRLGARTALMEELVTLDAQRAKLAAKQGHAILDDAAKETVRRAAPLPFYPQPITLTVKYSLAN